MACISERVITNKLCKFGCGNVALFEFRNGDYCCSKQAVQCSVNRKRIAKSTKVYFEKKDRRIFIDNGIRKKVHSINWRLCVTRVCGYCQRKFFAAIFLIKKGWCEFCSVKCRNKGLVSRGEHNGNWKGGLPRRRCRQCNKKFFPYYNIHKSKSYGRFCSKLCWWKNRCNNRAIYKGTSFKSLWEMYFAKWLIVNRLHYRYEPKKFDVGWFYYTPDFYVKEWKSYVEIKGHFSKENEKKFEFFRWFYKPSVRIFLLQAMQLKSLGVIA